MKEKWGKNEQKMSENEKKWTIYIVKSLAPGKEIKINNNQKHK
jgi:hypothetical protein